MATITSDPLAPGITPAPTNQLHQLGKRHFFTCGDLTLSWEQEWYTAPFFLSDRSSFDRAASRGAVNLPLDIYRTVGACQQELGITIESTITTTTNEDGVAVWTTETSVSTTRSSLVTRTESNSASTDSVSSVSASGSTTSTGFSTDVLGSSSASISASSSTLVSFSSTSSLPSASSTPVTLSTTNTCAGDWDWQSWGTVADLAFGMLIGTLLWATWAILRGRMPGFYSPRTWFVPQESRPSRPWSFLAFLIPFAHMPSLSSPSAPVSTAAIAQRTMFTGLKLAALSSLVALGAALPLFLVNVPCLGETSPRNELGGRLGTLTDLSLSRLLNALDPSPDSDSTSNFLHLPLLNRALPSTISPAISTARIRLIIILVLISVLSVGGGLFAIARAYAALSKYRKDFRDRICGGMSMVYIPSESAKAWEGLTEEKIKLWLKERTVFDEDEEPRELEAIGVFAVPDTDDLRRKMEERAIILDKLEQAEAKYIQHRSSPETSLKRVTFVPESKSSKATGAAIPTLAFDTADQGPSTAQHAEGLQSVPASAVPQVPNTEETGTRFLEINRDSAQFGRRFKIGQRIKVDEQGMYVPDYSPQSSEEDRRMSGDGLLSAATLSSRASSESFHTPPLTATLPLSPNEPTVPPPSAGLVAERHRHEEHDAEIAWYRTQFKGLNAGIEVLQQDTFTKVASVQSVLGWIVIGRGVEWLPHAQIIEGLTKEDILWRHANKPNGEKRFFVKVAAVGLVLFLISIPFLGLTVATSPGFAHYLPFLRRLSESDGFWAGVVEALVPAFVLSHLLMAAVLATQRFSKQIHCLSASRQRALAYKATFWLLLFVATVLPVTIAALEYATQGFAEDIQPARSVGDGAAFSTWFAFLFLLNMSVIVPGLLLLQPIRLLRYLFQRPSAVTPRQKYRRRLPPTFHPSIALAPTLVAVFYAATLLFIFPLLAMPILILLYLSFVVVHHQVEYLYAPSRGYEGATLALWTIRRFGWVLALQPLIYGLIVLSRNEWEIGGISIGVAVLTVILSELITVFSHPAPSRKRLSGPTRNRLDNIGDAIARRVGPAHSRPASGASSLVLRPRQSTSSMLRRLTALLPGLSRLPSDCPLPLPTQVVDDLQATERASTLRPDLKDEQYTQAADSNRGLIYPPEMTVDVPVIWLPRGKDGVSESEVNDLASNHGLEAIIDPPKRRKERKEGGGGDTVEKEVRAPLIPEP